MTDPFRAHPECQRVLVVDDEENIRHLVEVLLGRHGYRVTTASNADHALQHLREHDADLILSDVRMPGMDGLELTRTLRQEGRAAHVVLMSAFGDRQQAIDAIREGAMDHIPKPFRNEDLLFLLRKCAERIALQRENARLRAALESRDADTGLVARSPAMRAILDTVRKIAAYDATVLLAGESGTGKEQIARLIHSLSDRRKGPFVAINCAAIPESLLESELFGHSRGAFTGADRDRQGLFEAASEGTLLLDEIHELPLPIQPKLLRVLQERQIRRVGESRTRPVDARIIAAGITPLEQLVRDGRFREDLFYRLNMISLTLPPLRERAEDIPPLVERFLLHAAHRHGQTVRGFSPSAMNALLHWPWPGNVRELENTVERAVLLADSEVLGPDALPPALRGEETSPHSPVALDSLSIKEGTRRLERTLIERALRQTDGNRTHAARLLEISHRALLYKIKDYFPDGPPEPGASGSDA